MAGGGKTPTQELPPVYTGDTSQLDAYIKTDAGKKYAGVYKPGETYYQVNDSTVYGGLDLSHPENTQGRINFSGLLSDYQKWASLNNQTQTNWDAYSKAVAANQGGEGDNTITTGMGVSQRNQLLGNLANAGNPTAPTPGLGSMMIRRSK